ncbi:MAG TPA: AAA family ATPase, partial [Acidobacteriaceae bacterium]|nr:AAA family ATPase [Acidobacteriaceae bacterium]
MSKNIHDYIRTGYPAVAIATSDEDRTISAVTRAFLATHPDAPMWKIAATGGLVSLRPDPATGKAAVEPGVTYTPAFIKAGAMPSSLLIVLDFQHIIKNAAAYRGLRDALNTVKSANSMIVLIAPGWTMPAEVEHDIPLIHDGLPSREELSAALDLCVESTNAAMTADLRTAVLDSASGLTLAEAEGAMAMAFTGTTFDPAIVADEKMKLVRNSGYLEVSAPAKIGDLGGLGGLRTYCEQEILTVMHDPELRVRGVMLVGVPGTGKSLAARVLGAMMQYPVLRCDIAGLKGSHVGQSERQMRDALKLAEAVSP